MVAVQQEQRLLVLLAQRLAGMLGLVQAARGWGTAGKQMQTAAQQVG